MASVKIIKPDFLVKSEEVSKNYPGDLRGLFGVLGITSFILTDYYTDKFHCYLDVHGKACQCEKNLPFDAFSFSTSRVKKIAYVDNDMNVWVSKFEISVDGRLIDYDYSMGYRVVFCNPRLSLKNPLKWEVSNKIYDFSTIAVINNNNEMRRIISGYDPYLFNYVVETHLFDDKSFLFAVCCAPQIEQLDKAGYAFAKNVHISRGSDTDKINRLCNFSKANKKPKEIFKTTKNVYEPLRDCVALDVWDEMRKLVKLNPNISEDVVSQLVESGFSNVDLNKIAPILRETYNGKAVFTFDSLVNYLARIDQYEAISRYEGLSLLSDYLRMCRQLKVEPKVDGDSLKREHDVMARNVRMIRNEKLAKKMESACMFSDWNYEDEKFTVRHVADYDELLDEACQQHNCVASYADRIAQRKSLIYLLRNKSTPDKSLVTIELSNKGDLRQKYLAYNQPIRNKEITDFIEKWISNIVKA